MRRSGSTTLATLVADFSDFPRIEHEPFNPGRVLHPIVERFVASRDEDRLREEIREALAASTEATPVQNIFFTIARSNLTQQTIEKLGSLENEPWKDPAEIGTSLKDGQVRATEYKKVKPITVTATIAYRPL